MNGPRACPVTFVRILGEDTDVETYELRDGEETPVVDEYDGVYPVGRTFVQKDGPNTMVHFLSESDSPTKVQSESEVSDAWVTPPKDEYDPIPHRSPVSAPDPVPRAKPEWWTPVWDRLSETISSRGFGVEEPMCPLQFREECGADVTAIDQYGTRLAYDSDTGGEIKAGEDNDLTEVVVGVVWSDNQLTMTRVGDQRVDSHDLYRRNLRAMMEMCPESGEITVFTESAELLREWTQICEYAMNGFGNLTAGLFPYECQEIMKQLELKRKRTTMHLGSGSCGGNPHEDSRVFYGTRELAEMHPQNARTPDQMIQGFQGDSGRVVHVRLLNEHTHVWN
jgi:hypothetical protein